MNIISITLFEFPFNLGIIKKRIDASIDNRNFDNGLWVQTYVIDCLLTGMAVPGSLYFVTFERNLPVIQRTY